MFFYFLKYHRTDHRKGFIVDDTCFTKTIDLNRMRTTKINWPAFLIYFFMAMVTEIFGHRMFIIQRHIVRRSRETEKIRGYHKGISLQARKYQLFY